MTTYLIHESNFERLEKKMATLSKKCAQSHCSLTYTVKGEQFKTYTNDEGEEYIAKFYEVEVEGTAKYNGWRFVATLDHHTEGNVIRAYDTELTIPEKYKTCGPTCEHCNRIRTRKDTFLVYNDETKEFKQVGKTCLQEFTNGLSAENIAFFVSIYEQFEQSGGYSGPSFNRYIDVEDIARYAFECYKHWGYQKSRNSLEGDIPIGYRSTSDRVVDYYYIKRAFSKDRERLQREMDEVGFDANSADTVETSKAALEWIRNEKDLDSEYIRNLHVICSDRYTDYRSLGILVSLTTAYNRHIGKLAAYEAKQKKEAEEKKASDYVGKIGDKVEIACKDFNCVSSWDGMYGMTFLYKFTDNEGNVFIWYASNAVNEPERVVSVKGSIKDHSEYNGLKQTVLTRCRVTLGELPKAEPKVPEGFAPIPADIDDAIESLFA